MNSQGSLVKKITNAQGVTREDVCGQGTFA